MKNHTRNIFVWAGITLGLAVLPTSSPALTYNYVQVSGGSCCTVDTKNTVQVSDTTVPNGSTPLAAGVFDILVTLDTSTAAPWTFQKNAGNKATGHAASFAFSTSLTLTGLTSITPNDFFANSNNPMGAYQMSPFSFPANGYGVSQNTKNNMYSTLDFLVNTGTSYTLAQFIATLLPETSDSNILFAADVRDGSIACDPDCTTGAIGFASSDISGETPLPGALPLFATGLGALGLLGWRKKRRTAKLAA